MDYENKDFASKGVGAAGLTLGIIGTALGALGTGNGNGLFGGLTGNRSAVGAAAVEAGTMASLYGAQQIEKVSCLEAELSELKAERYTDNISHRDNREILEAMHALSQNTTAAFKEVNAAIIGLEKREAADEKEMECLRKELDFRFNAAETDSRHRAELLRCELAGAIALESERRMCGDRNIVEYVNATFVPGKLIMPASSICPPVELATTTTPAS